MTYGFFDDANREYVITNPRTPWPWINYLGTDGFFSLISNTAGGYAFYKDAKFRRLLRYRYNGVPMDAGGRYFYIKDGDTVWNPGWKPVKTELDRYECRHGMNYTEIIGEKNGLEARALFFVPLGINAEVTRLSLTNLTDKPRTFKLFSLVEWCLWNASTDMENFQRNFSTGEVEIDDSTIYHKTEFRERRNHYAFYHLNAPIDGFDTDRESFIGLYNGFHEPQVVEQGHSNNSVAHGWSPIASHYKQITLQPGATEHLVFILGYVEIPEQGQKWESHQVINKQPAREIIEQLDTVWKVNAHFDRLKSYWDDLLSKFRLEDSDPRLERMVNVWNQYQCMITFCFSRSASFFESGIGRGMGFRDSNQDLVGFVHQVPERARQRIIDIASTQFADGGCYHQYQPLTKRGNNDIGSGFNDDPLWLIFGTAAYVKETGDFSILNEPVPFDNQPGSEVPLMEHLRVSLNHVVDNLGPHGLPLIGRADWNDCLNLNCFSNDPDESFQTTENNTEGSQAESLMIAGQFVVTANEYAALCQAAGKKAEANRAVALAQEMSEAIKTHGWDGEWFLRAYDFHGNKVGSHQNEEGKIFIESQGWCSMAGVGADEGMVEKSLNSVKRMLDSEHGIVLNNPPFSKYLIEYGEISSYPEGYKENAGIFAHNNPWIIIAEAMLGHGRRAWEYYCKICPSFTEPHSDLHKVEPYVYCQMIAGKDAATPGQGKNSWLTGTAAWNWYAITEYLLGIRPHYDGLIINPCVYPIMTNYTVHRKFRGANYHITVNNPMGVCQGVKLITLNGVSVRGNLVPVQPAGTDNTVIVTLGPINPQI